MVGGSKLDHLDEITANDDAVRAFLREQTSNRTDIKFGEVVYCSQYRYRIDDFWSLLKLKDRYDAGSIFEW